MMFCRAMWAANLICLNAAVGKVEGLKGGAAVHLRLLFIQVCSGPTPAQSHTGLGKMQLPAAVQNGLTAALCHCKYTYEDLVLNTAVQWPNTSAVPHCFWHNAVAPYPVLLCKSGWQQAYFAAKTSVEICPLLSAALQKLCPGQFERPNAQGCLQNRLIAGCALAVAPMKNFPSHTYANDPNTSALRQIECLNAQD